MEDELEILSAYLDGELTEEERREVEARLKGSSELRAELVRLQETRNMLSECIQQPAFHRAVIRRVRQEAEDRPRGAPLGWKWATAAAFLAILLCSVAYFVLKVSPPGASIDGPVQIARPARTPTVPEPASGLEPAEETPAGVLRTLLGILEPAVSTAVALETPAEVLSALLEGTPGAGPLAGQPAELPLSLTGTIPGAQPVAILNNNETGDQGAYRVGEEVLPGVILVAVRDDSAVLDNNGTEVTLWLGVNVPARERPELDGLWEMAIEMGDQTQYIADVSLKEEYGKVKLIIGDVHMLIIGDGHTFGEGSLVGNKTRLQQEMGGGEFVLVLEGTFNEDWTKLNLAYTEISEGLSDDDAEEFEEYFAKMKYVLTKVPAGEEQRRDTIRGFEQEVREMASALVEYARANQERYPVSLAALVPQYAPNLDKFSERDDRKLRYFPGKRLPDMQAKSLPPLNEYYPDIPMPDRLMTRENELRSLWGGDDWLKKFFGAEPILEVAYADPEMTFVVNSNGRFEAKEEEQPSEKEVPFDSELGKMKLDAWKASCQNNLKQLGIVIKMHENGKEGYTPPGWRSVYPDYLTDLRVLTSPKDEPGTDSYPYLFPAIRMNDIAWDSSGNLVQVDRSLLAEEEAAQYTFVPQSELPLAMNRTDWPGPDPGRNVLFADGHVVYIRTNSDTWREQILPYVNAANP